MCSLTLLHKVGGRKEQCLCTQHKHMHPSHIVAPCICHPTSHSIPFFLFALLPSVSLPSGLGSFGMMTSVLVCPDGRPLNQRPSMAVTRRVERPPPAPSVRGRGHGISAVVALCHDPLLVAYHQPHGCIFMGSNSRVGIRITYTDHSLQLYPLVWSAVRCSLDRGHEE